MFRVISTVTAQMREEFDHRCTRFVNGFELLYRQACMARGELWVFDVGHRRRWRRRLILLSDEELTPLDVLPGDNNRSKQLPVGDIHAVDEDQVQAVVDAFELPLDCPSVRDTHTEDTI